MDKDVKEQRINDEYAKLRKTLKNVTPDKIQMAEGLIGNAAFMNVTLDELKDEINSRGALTTYNKNLVENPATKSYNTMINRYSAVMAQLLNLLPKDEQPIAAKQVDSKEEKLKKFIKKASDKK
jgi:phage terminase small subunit